MNFDRSLIFSYLEEDNIQRAYFRVRPLLTLEGDVRQEALQLWPNEGGLRIVPDRNEQHTFKVRMRTLGSYCVVDLRGQPPEAGKIRTNKNYHPDRGEINQYILYSDTVHPLPENTFYQLIDGQAEDYEQLAKAAITPLFFIRQEKTLYGPVHKDSPARPETAPEASAMLYEVPCPDGVARLILCIGEKAAALPVNEVETPTASADEVPPQDPPVAAAPAAVDAAPVVEPVVPAEEALPIGEALSILDQNTSHEDTLKQLDKPVSAGANLLHQSAAAPVFTQPVARKDEPLSGTPLVRKPLHVAIQQTKNHTQEIVSNQWSVGKYEPPAQNLPAGTAMRSVENPVEAACTALREAWHASSAHDQLTDCILSLDGLRAKLEEKLCNGSSVTIMQRVLRQRLQDLEAERLTALCELDKAKRDVDAYKHELLNGMSARLTKEKDKLQADCSEAETQLSSLKNEVNALTLQRDALLTKINELQTNTLPETVAKLAAEAQMSAPVSGVPLRLSPVSGANVEADDILQRIISTARESGLDIDRNTAVAITVLLAICPRLGVACTTPAAVSTLMKNLACALGWASSYAHQFSAEQHPMVGVRPVDSTAAILTTSLPNYSPISGLTKIMLNRNAGNLVRNAAYDVSQWPVLMLPALPFIPESTAAEAPAVSSASMARIAESDHVSTNELDAVLAPILRAASPLSGSAKKEMYRFVSVCTGLMEGGLPVAADWGILLWVIPALERGSRNYAAVKALLDEYPLSLSKLQ